MSSKGVLCLTLLAAMTAGSNALAFCRSSTCGENHPLCEPSTEEPCGLPLRWDRSCLGFSVQHDGTPSIPLDEIRKAAVAGFGVWQAPFCGGQKPSIRILDLGYVACGQREYNKSAGNTNVLVFRNKTWPHPDKSGAIALTTTTFLPQTGELVDVDIEFNTATFALTTTNDPAAYDLTGIIAHEAGHFLGLDHSNEAQATMAPNAFPGSLDLRVLKEDDQVGLCTIYPPNGKDQQQCNPIPYHGFASDCGADQYAGTCSARGNGLGHSGKNEIEIFAVSLFFAAILHLRSIPKVPTGLRRF